MNFAGTFTLTSLAAYSLLGTAPANIKALTVIGLLFMVFLFIIEPIQPVSRWKTYTCLFFEATIGATLLTLNRGDTPFAVVFFVLSAQTVSALKTKAGFLWITAYVIASGIIFFHFVGFPRALIDLAMFGSGYFFFGIFALSWAKTEAANQRNKELLAKLEEAHRLLQQQAVRDPLTNLFNRRYLEETLDRELARSRRQNLALGLVMLDIDHFKKLNDSYGHLAGDEVLRQLSSVITLYCREEDIPCRIGGEEFLIVLPGMPPELLKKRAEQWRAAVENMTTHWEGHAIKTTISLGTASFPHHGETSQQIIQSADQALYRAKENGRNRVEEFSSSH